MKHIRGAYPIICALALCMFIPITAHSGESKNGKSTGQKFVAEKYLGQYENLEKDGYTDESGIGTDYQRQPEAIALAVCKPFKTDSQFDCVLVLTEIDGRERSGHAIRSEPSDMIRIKLPKGWRYFDSGDTECRATDYPNAEVIAIGKWTWRKKPMTGGFAHSLKNAWRIDYQKMRFVEISVQKVECGFNDER